MNSVPIATPTECRSALERAADHSAGFVTAYLPELERRRLPRSVERGEVRLVPTDDWTSGFPAGSLWLLYEHTRSPRLREFAERFTEALFQQRHNTSTHDVGFMIQCSYGAGYRLTESAAYAEVILEAAAALETRFDERVGATRSWSFGSWAFPVIIDNMLNLELFWQAHELSRDERFSVLAEQHALTTLQHHFRPDGSSYHLIDFDPASGEVIKKQTHQGVDDESAWARGQAWGLYGFTMMAARGGDARFLRQAERIADYWLGHPGLPADGVPYFDFVVPERPELPRLRDASAAAIAASALLELARLSPASAERYRHAALETLATLSSDEYRAAPGDNCHFLLKHSVGSYPEGVELDAALNYADYYYLEALSRAAALDTSQR